MHDYYLIVIQFGHTNEYVYPAVGVYCWDNSSIPLEAEGYSGAPKI